jgi:hypothetical protein
MVRDEASDVFGGRDALEAGYNYLPVSNGLKAAEITNALGAYNPAQLQRFKDGVLSRLKEEALKPPSANSGFGKLVSYFDRWTPSIRLWGSNPAIEGRLRQALGDDDFYRLSNQVNIQNIVNKAKTFRVREEVIPSGGKGMAASSAALLGAGGAYLVENAPALSQVLNPANMTLATVGAGALAGTAAGLAGLYKVAGMFQNKFERAVATHIANALANQDPVAIAALNRIPPKNLNKYLTRFSYALEGTGVPSREVLKGAALDGKDAPLPPEDPATPKKRTLKDMLPPQAGAAPQNAGGRVGRKAGGRIKSNPISAEIMRVRALLSEKTASMLSVPDDAIATALHIAKGK